jgi:hypothetical protein
MMKVSDNPSFEKSLRASSTAGMPLSIGRIGSPSGNIVSVANATPESALASGDGIALSETVVERGHFSASAVKSRLS